MTIAALRKYFYVFCFLVQKTSLREEGWINLGVCLDIINVIIIPNMYTELKSDVRDFLVSQCKILTFESLYGG